MPRRHPSFVPLLIVTVMLAHVAAVGQSDVAKLPPDVPKSRLALGDTSKSAASKSTKNSVLLTGGSEVSADDSILPRKLNPPPSMPAPMAFGPDSAMLGSEKMLPPAAEPIATPETPATAMQPGCPPAANCPPANCPPPSGPLRTLWNLPVKTFDWIFNPPPRHRGLGQPLARESWRYRPFSLGLFVGYINGGTLIDNWTGSDSAAQGGFRLGWDPGYYWGCEFRFAACSMGQWDSADAIDFAELENGTYHSNRDVSMELWDLSVLYYPWGDSTWRPYFLTGLGGAQLGFDDSVGNHWSRQAFAMPIALGVKYRYNSRFAFRFELADNIVFGSGQVETVHHVSLTGGLEIRFGGQRSVYWPWSPGKQYW